VAPEKEPSLHRQVAEAIEVVYPGQEAFNRMLLEHWKAAGDFDKEMQYLVPVAHRMVGVTDEHLEARVLLESGLRRLAPDDSRRILLLNILVFSHWRQGNYAHAETIGRETLPLAQQAGDADGLAECLRNLGMTLSRLGKYEESLQYFKEALSYAADADVIGHILNNLGVVHLALGDNAEAMRCYQASLARHEETGNQWAAAMVLNNLGMEYARLKDYEQGYASLQRSLTIRQRLGDQWGMAGSYNNMGLIATWQDDVEGAARYLNESLSIYRHIGARREVANALVNLGYVEAKHGRENARQTLTESLSLALATNSIPIVLEGLACFVWILARQGDEVGAVELLGFIQAHPAYNIEVFEKLEELLPTLEEAVDAERFEQVKTGGARQELDEVMRRIFGEKPPVVIPPC
ncbi:MAG: tetratricopeptide repeat protein, partial [Chloroflexi bacterium]|nr:tetratricopeptide repeat protein [Chloroflexota bacterium]